MEGSFQGDLADVVRASGGGVVAGDTTGNASCSSFPVDHQLPMHPLSTISDEGFGDPFPSMRDPLLVELEGIDHGVGSSTSSSSPFHGDFMAEMIDDSAAPAFQISCASDHDANASGGGINEQMRVNCDLRGLITPAATCDLREGLMNLSSPNKGSSSSFVDTSRNQISSPRNPILKRRKSQMKKVVSIPAPTTANSRQGGGEVVPSDLWAWRKYGQKPIKGSPYPRGYYRCSSSKGCSARKQVERSRTDPNMLVITYTSEHNHPWPTQRNSLAGSSRIPIAATSSSSSKPLPPQTTTIKEETDPQKTRVTNKDITASIDQSKSSVKTDHRTMEAEDNNIQNDVVLPNQAMMNELVFDYDQSYRPLIQEAGESDQGFFADLRELEESDDPLNGFLFDHGNKSTLEGDLFGSLFDWSTSSNSNTTTTTNSGRQDNDS